MILKVKVASFIAILFLSLKPHASAQVQPSVSTDVGKTTPDIPPKVGDGVTAPRIRYGPSPMYSEEARKAGLEGTCRLWLIVDTDGKPRDIRVMRALGMGLDEKAIEAVRTWVFDPARKEGKPVAVQVNVEVAFHLADKPGNAKIPVFRPGVQPPASFSENDA